MRIFFCKVLRLLLLLLRCRLLVQNRASQNAPCHGDVCERLQGGDVDGERRGDHDVFFVVHDEVADVGDEQLDCLGSQETAFWIIRVRGHVVQVVHLVGIFSC